MDVTAKNQLKSNLDKKKNVFARLWCPTTTNTVEFDFRMGVWTAV